MFTLFSSLIFSLILLMVFFSMMKKNISNLNENSSFECGFTSYYFSRFSFSLHYFYIGILFLFLDLELILIMPFFNLSLKSVDCLVNLTLFILILILGLLEEWMNKKLEWKY